MSLRPGESPGYLLWVVSLRWQREIAAVLAPLDLTHTQFVLLASAWWLGENDEVPHQVALAQHAGTDIKTASQVLRSLEGKGLIERRVDRADPRAKRVHVTPAGSELAPVAMAAVESADRAFFAVVPEEEVLRVLRKLTGRAR